MIRSSFFPVRDSLPGSMATNLWMRVAMLIRLPSQRARRSTDLVGCLEYDPPPPHVCGVVAGVTLLMDVCARTCVRGPHFLRGRRRL